LREALRGKELSTLSGSSLRSRGHHFCSRNNKIWRPRLTSQRSPSSLNQLCQKNLSLSQRWRQKKESKRVNTRSIQTLETASTHRSRRKQESHRSAALNSSNRPSLSSRLIPLSSCDRTGQSSQRKKDTCQAALPLEPFISECLESN